ncbi:MULTISPECIES: hypothetical protein [unclassified Crossiella]|uniref:hypothetical protein n=1 Tax=unclassified Crossiella TaxID=2620835 RepID=UPI001FFF25FE|nr:MULTISPECIES: hypothetical protein [unclassified Crossiella]MCK2238845.1 hypothetical protein [Crossiella sp. S99.2]MCK2251585.1 hypothetical protein [Crossiella sp. S99.1]
MAKSVSAIDGVQGVIALVGITLGGVPLVRWFIEGQHSGPFRWLFGEQTGTMGYVAPLLVIGVAIGLIAVLERRKRA